MAGKELGMEVKKEINGLEVEKRRLHTTDKFFKSGCEWQDTLIKQVRLD